MGYLNTKAKKALGTLITLCETNDKWILLESGLYVKNKETIEIKKNSCDEDIGHLVKTDILYEGKPNLSQIIDRIRFFEENGVHMTIQYFNKLNQFFQVPTLQNTYKTGEDYSL